MVLVFVLHNSMDIAEYMQISIRVDVFSEACTKSLQECGNDGISITVGISASETCSSNSSNQFCLISVSDCERGLSRRSATETDSHNYSPHLHVSLCKGGFV